ncbi:unnamed protein product [Dimorphilus gyrociliatus]|uniref:Uncharacterized protein n=1 Tax=Dimorphilus gyrociliatus TaxID=2664684 RepID=A0A7I8V6T2_9ANNE|nr:unnamed protein product [Dimorphilus gyrociliatus]
MKGINSQEKTVKSTEENESSINEAIRKFPIEKKKQARPKQGKGGKKSVEEEKTSTILEQIRNMDETNEEVKGNSDKEDSPIVTTFFETASPGPTITTSAVRSSLTGPIRMNRSTYILPTQPPPSHCRYPPPPPPSHAYYQPYPTHYCGRLPGRCVRPTNPYPRYCGPPLIDFSFPHCPTSYEQESTNTPATEESKGNEIVATDTKKEDGEELKSGEEEGMSHKDESLQDKVDESDDRFSFRRMLFEENAENGAQGQQAPPRRYSKIQTSIDAISAPIMPPPPPPHPSFVYRPMFDFEHNQLEEDVVTKTHRNRDEQEEEIRERQRTISQILNSDSDRDTARYELDTLMVIYIEYILLDTKSILGRPSQDIVRHFAASIYDEIKCMQKLLTGKSMHMTHRIRQFLSIHSISFDSLMKLTRKIQAASAGNFSNKQVFSSIDGGGGSTHSNGQARRYIRPSLVGEPKRSGKRQKKNNYKTVIGEESIDSSTDSEVELRCGIPPSDCNSPTPIDLARIKAESCLEEVQADSTNAIVMVDDPVMGANVAADVVVGTDTSSSHHITDNMQILSADIAEHIFSADQIEMLAEHASLLLQNEDACEEFMIEDDKRTTHDDPITPNEEVIKDNRNRRGRKKLSKKLTKDKRKFKKSREIE